MCIPWAIRTTGSIPTMAAASPKESPESSAELDPPDAAYFQQRFQDFDKRLTAAEQKWDAEMKPYRGTQGRDLSQFVPQFRQAFRAECDRLRRAAAGHSAHAEPHHRTDRADEARELQADPGRAVFRFEDSQQSIARETGGKVVQYLPSVGGEKEVTDYFKLFDYDIGLADEGIPVSQ